MEFENKTVVVTGAAGIFGRWIAAYFAREGAVSACPTGGRTRLKRLSRSLASTAQECCCM